MAYRLKTFQVQFVAEPPEFPRGSHCRSAEDVAIVARAIYRTLDADKEHFLLLTMNNKTRVNGFKVVSTGTLTASLVHPREVWRAALVYIPVTWRLRQYKIGTRRYRPWSIFLLEEKTETLSISKFQLYVRLILKLASLILASAMIVKRSLAAIALMLLCGCAGFETAGEFSHGRQALLRGDAGDSLAFFERVAAAEPNYRSSDRPLREGIWTYIGRAQYQSGKYAEAKTSLEKALAQHGDDDMARLYLGLTLARAASRGKNENQSAQAAKELTAAFSGLRDKLNQFIATSPRGNWDPGGDIRKEIGNGLTLLGSRNPDWSQIISSGEWLGQNLEEEIDRARMTPPRD
jgi:RadC-like JAB domain